MNLKTQFVTAILLLLFSSAIYSQTNNPALLIENNPTLNSQTVPIYSLLKSKMAELQNKSMYKSSASTSRLVDSVHYVLANGERFNEHYNYEGLLITSYYNDIWNGERWSNYEKWLIEFDEYDNNTIDVKETWTGTEWQPDSRNTNGYDLYGNNTSIIAEDWDSTQSQWITSMTGTSEFDLNGNRIFVEVVLYLDSFNAKLQSTLEYNSENLLISETITMFMDDLLMSDQRNTYTYDINKNMVSSLIEEYVNDSWSNWRLVTNEYDVVNNLILRTNKLWDKDLNVWVNNDKYVFEYDLNNNQTSELQQSWVQIDSNWINTRRYTSQYNSGNNLVLNLQERTDSTQSWVYYDQYAYEFNEAGNLFSATYEKWIDGAWQAGNGYCEFDDPRGNGLYFYFNAYKIEEVFYGNVTGISVDPDLLLDYSLLQNYPNPFNPGTSIEYQVASIENVTLKVYDVLGNEVTTLVNEQKTPGSYEVKFTAANLSSGVYFYTLQAGSFIQTKKLLLLK